MPTSFSNVAHQVSMAYAGLVSVALNRNATMPPVGTHMRKTRRIDARTHVRRLRGFSRNLSQTKTVNDLRKHIAAHIQVHGRLLQASEVMIFGHDHKTLHGAKHLK